MNHAARNGVPLAALALTALLLGAGRSGPSAEVRTIQAPVIRVLLDSSAEPLSLRSPSRLAVHDGKTRALLTELPAGTHAVTRLGGRFRVGSAVVTADAVRLTAVDGRPLGVRGKSYPGSLAVVAAADGRMSIVNLVDLESYVAGVVGLEIGFSAPAEAQKAQAVAARTYAVARAREMRTQFPSGAFDLYADTRSQVYGGVCTHDKVWQAVWATVGTVMTDRGHPFVAYYHATCGGMTESAAHLFPAHRCGPLAGGVTCDWCKGARRRVWTVTLPEWRIRSRLNESGYSLGPLLSIVPEERTTGGRSARLLLTWSGPPRGGSLRLPTQDFRRLAGDDAIHSARFRVVRQKDGFRFEGEGWGHGVGMCQEGAIGLARSGRAWPQILALYYPGHAPIQAYGQ